ncbi:MAG: hypothetical protein FWB78_07515 [Treponema sp.]|nr:hypothetical protein [Treponema sp.]
MFLRVVFVLFMTAMFFTPLSAQAQATRTLDAAVRDGARHLQDRIPNGTRVAIVAVQGEDQDIGELVLRKLGEALVNANRLIVVERDSAALTAIDQEMDRHLNFYVSQETELFVGRQLGAEVIISGSMARAGQNWRLEVNAVTVETAQRVVQWSAANIRPDPSWDADARPPVAAQPPLAEPGFVERPLTNTPPAAARPPHRGRPPVDH